MLLLTAGADIGGRIFVAIANEKFISIFVRVFGKSDAPGHYIGKSGCKRENCHATTSV